MKLLVQTTVVFATFAALISCDDMGGGSMNAKEVKRGGMGCFQADFNAGTDGMQSILSPSQQSCEARVADMMSMNPALALKTECHYDAQCKAVVVN